MKRNVSMLHYRCNACVTERLRDKGFYCKYSIPHEENSQGYIVTKCPVFGDKVQPNWDYFGETILEPVETK
jgi:hypothetical protein